MKAKRHVLLTGAGFTRNFGAPLSSELWSIILGSPHLSNYPEVRQILLEDFDFESVYHRVLSGSFTEDEKTAMNHAVREAYAYIDSAIENLGSGIFVNNVQRMISRFAGDRLQPGFFFTLNQDLFLERHYFNGERPALPGIKRGPRWFTSNFNTSLEADDVCSLPHTAPPLNELLSHTGFYYVKLHGSMNWYSAVGNGQQMIIGHGKDAQISSEPILARYFELFQDVLCSGERKLLSIGYSFADSHINQVLLSSIKSGLQLFVLAPGSPGALKKRLDEQNCGQLWFALAEYFPFALETLFPSDQSVTPQWKHVRRRFFDDQHGLA